MGEKKSLAKLMEATRARHTEGELDPFETGSLDPIPPSANAGKSTPEPPGRRNGASGDRVHTSIYLPYDVWRRLRAIAAAEDCKVHDLIMEGVNEVVGRRPDKAGTAV